MCGIAGIVQNKKGKISKEKIKTMVKAVAHRGPDDEGLYLDEKNGVALGHRRLSILDLSAAGHQPMPSEDGTLWITFNGEIYNYLELRKELRDGAYRSGSDTEIILRAYEKWGEDCVKKFNGIFAFAIWDKNKKSLFCGRDHLGVKPFYYAFQNGVFYFGSEIKALLAAGIKTKPNGKIIYEYLTYGYYQHSKETFFENIYQLPAGHTLIFKNGKLEIKKYWDVVSKLKNIDNWSDGKVREEFLNIFEDAINLQLRSDVPIGIQLSGGFDSSAVTAMVDKVCGGQRNFRVFSFIYKGYKDKEKPFMKVLARELGWVQEFFSVSPSNMSDLMNEAVWHQDEPFPGLPTFGQHILAKACRKDKIPVILGGQGGDEVAAGYEYYFGAFLLDMIKEKGSEAALKELFAYRKLHNFDQEKTFIFFINSLNSYFQSGTSADGTSFTKSNALNGDFLRKNFVPRAEFEKPFDNALKNMQYRDIFYTKLPRILHAADRSAMAYGVEHRVPFLDYRLVEFGFSLSNHQKIRNGEQRYFARMALKKMLPGFVGGAVKRAVPSPQREWFKDELRPWVHSILSSKSFGQRPYFNQKEVLSEYKRYCATPGVPANSFHIWQWIHLETWLRTYFD